MIAILGGLGAAVCWAISTLCSSRSTRVIGPWSVVAWVAVVGFVITFPFLLAAGVPAALHGSNAVWLLISGIANIAGLGIAYIAYREGDVALLAPLISTEGATAAVISLAFGEHLPTSTLVTLAVIAVGISLAALAPSKRADDGAPKLASYAIPCALLAALTFGLGLYSTGRAGNHLPLVWVVIAPRLIGVAAVAAPLAAKARLRLTRRSVPLVVASGVAEVLGLLSYALGARHDIAVAAVLASQFAAISALAGFVFFGERLGRVQVVGVLVVIAGVSVLGALRG